MKDIDISVNTGTIACILAYIFALSFLLEVRSLTLATCAAKALPLQATTTIISGATAAKSHIGEPHANTDCSKLIVDIYHTYTYVIHIV